ncbi:signal recognition particle-docking protein FtsY [Zavarzinia compransoris]|uniref:Signal recognition particle receptor FtsY n=1 Tax=Zavarzinia compransoris TaxID=1264899 RepID=A0A317E512_9PROT|nr:signal recognition particle-docking protein FtsY [Zavarzinia compransoris]PWR22079.1 signal recognition particle-docking protein FtsY [Zavarzinia compransoris]TDP47178.1 fused signal recognition particle receptor [Zavarzinia compransoris]
MTDSDETGDVTEKKGWFTRLKAGLSRSSSSLGQSITALFKKRKLDDETLDELEEALIRADLGVQVASEVREALAKGRFGKEVTDEEVKAVLAEEVARILKYSEKPLVIDPARKPHVILMVGVNGTGKTTTIGKLASRFKAQGLKVMLAAGDTFRAAAIEQLAVWGERSDVPVITRPAGSDAAGLAFDAFEQAKREGCDVLLIDTAGRLQNKEGLMAELTKIERVLKKLDPEAPHDTIIVLDATTGQNAVTQVDVFERVAKITGVIMTKLDGTARGGVLVAVAKKYWMPIHAIGVGEGIDDFQDFNAEAFAKALAGVAEGVVS